MRAIPFQIAQSIFFAPARVIELNLCRLPRAVVCIGFPVAAADGSENSEASRRDLGACALGIEDFALSCGVLAKESGVAGNADDASAGLTEPNRRCVGRREQRRTQGHRQCRDG